ncbi:PEP-CTERM sorting domain-containing protein [Sphingomonas sp. AP4-R1]|uniref:PEP-CTERM sorting domain-containing protein n=1 Tax=Sphingomonas sp. AP4-R1 TaxID=2735134 RepID=UPI0014939A5D|nr:PEP-CTERM sorting domain-containing protein [Sphingomonas sp. AP4-R1]QJU56835.1 PEP-CTERM sorting domain-containing protein [Sphingomonas sp. AP4-R1]
MRNLLCLTAIAITILITGPADAALITRSYIARFRYSQGPVLEVTQYFTLTYDPNGPTFYDKSVDSYYSDSDISSFNPTGGVLFTYLSYGSDGIIFMGGAPSGAVASTPAEPDFYTYFRTNGYGEGHIGTDAPVGYNTLTNSYYADVQYFTNLAPSAVPEPESWATFISGIGLIGMTIRRRKKLNIRFA